jgi:hypothetical protein
LKLPFPRLRRFAMTSRHRFLPHGLALVLALWQGAPRAQPVAEGPLKAEILWRALQFVEWPGDLGPAQPLQLCLLAPGALADALRGWEQRTLHGHAVELRRVAGPASAVACHIAYVGADAVLPAQPPRALLWVGDSLGLTERGVMINLQLQQGRIVFDVELQAARRAGLDINARLLRLARYVRTEGQP